MHEMYGDAAGPQMTAHRLQSFACYYRQHYVALAQMPDQTWVKFDDTVVSPVGTWSDVILTCVSGNLQPAMLMYCLR